MLHTTRCTALPGLLLALVLPAIAHADDPKYEYGKAPEADVKVVTWKASAQAGLVIITGNAEATTISGALIGSRLEGKNKLALELGGVYVKSGVLIIEDKNADGDIDIGEFSRTSQTTSKNFLGKARYDRFFTARNAAYGVGSIGADVPAGKDLFGGGQVGYSRTLVKGPISELVVEAGYDYTYVDLSAADPVSIHSARFFVGYTGTMSATTGLSASLETQLNLNAEDAPYLGAGEEIAPFEDTRVIAKLAVTSALAGDISVRFGFTAKYDQAPAPLAKIAGFPTDALRPPLAETLDTTTELQLIVNFL
jgi:hypothetical protein